MVKHRGIANSLLSFFLVTLIGFALVVNSGCSSERATEPGDLANLVDPADRKPPGPHPHDDGTFSLEAKYTAIESVPGGGGIFVFRLIPSDDFAGDVELSLNAHRALGASLSRKLLTLENPIVEIVVKPKPNVPIDLHTIELRALHADSTQSEFVTVEIFDKGPYIPGTANQKRDEFVAWLESEHPELGDFDNRKWFVYFTYPNIWIVEHWTYLDDDWEFRVCFHVMIPPHDWSKMLLRGREVWDPELAAMRAYDSTTATYEINEIPVSEYPTFGY